jgi:transcriptional regulator with XRE-family HTH domain
MGKIAESIRKRLGEIKDSEGFTAFSRRTGIPQPRLSGWYTQQDPSVETIERLAEALHTSPWELLRPPDAVPANPEKERLDALQALLAVLPQLDNIALRGVLDAAHVALHVQREAARKPSVEDKTDAK